MAKTVLEICTNCDRGEDLYKRVKRARRDFELKDVFKVRDVGCLDRCADPINADLHRKGDATVELCELSRRDAEDLVMAARQMAQMPQGQWLAPHKLPGKRV